MTQEQALELWLRDRDDYLGGSDAFELLEQMQYQRGCRRALALRKLRVPSDVPIESEDAGERTPLTRGRDMEAMTVAYWEQATGRLTRRPPSDDYGIPRPRHHARFPWAAVNADRIILTGHGDVEETGILECKTRDMGPYYRVLRLGPFAGDLLQVQWALWVTGYAWGALAVLGVFGSLPLLHFDMNANPEVHGIFERIGSEFAEQVWGKGEAPAPTFPASDPRCRVCVYRLSCRGEEIDRDEAAALRAVKSSSKNLVQISNEPLAQTLADIDALKQEQRSIEESLEIAKQRALEQLGNVEAAWLKTYGKVYRLPTQANYFDAQALKADDPAMYDRYMVHRLTGDYYLRTYPTKEKTHGIG